MRLASLLLLASLMTSAAPPPRNLVPRHVIIDTDAGSDDLMAIAFLLARKDLTIEAITVVNGLAHVPAGARNILRLLELAGRRDVPVYLGRETPLAGNNEFPEVWRALADAMPSITLPDTALGPEAVSAFTFLRGRLANPNNPVSLIALGPLTNLAEVLTAAPNSAAALRDLVVMGGAVRVAGNLPGGGPNYLDNRNAEWNIYIDPVAARKVLQSVITARLVPLDASNTVPFNLAFLADLTKSAKSKLGQFAAQVLASNRLLVEQNAFYAWDPLAAVAFVNPAVLKISSVSLEIMRAPPEEGRIIELVSGFPVRAALSADPFIFRKTFLETLR